MCECVCGGGEGGRGGVSSKYVLTYKFHTEVEGAFTLVASFITCLIKSRLLSSSLVKFLIIAEIDISF